MSSFRVRWSIDLIKFWISQSTVEDEFHEYLHKILKHCRCIPVKECPCIHSGQEYTRGQEIQQDCNTWWVWVTLYSIFGVRRYSRTAKRGDYASHCIVHSGSGDTAGLQHVVSMSHTVQYSTHSGSRDTPGLQLEMSTVGVTLYCTVYSRLEWISRKVKKLCIRCNFRRSIPSLATHLARCCCCCKCLTQRLWQLSQAVRAARVACSYVCCKEDECSSAV